ncbi:MAG: 50S ribosomal protein L20 [Clostridiales bacterium]|jgi:large subunit ribosomal protein L20|nr:50S ribosomal protein L20 [Clostridiales bacterium]
MPRVKGGLNAKKRQKKVLKLAKGYYGARSKQYKAAKQAVIRAMAHAYVGRKQVKRDFRRLWITRINAAARINGMSYSRFMNGLKVSGIDINRKMLAEMAIHDAPAFSKLVETAKAAV